MTIEKMQPLVLKLNFTNIIATIGICLPILILQGANHKELMNSIQDLKDSVMVEHVNFVNHEIIDAGNNMETNRRVKDCEDKIYQLTIIKNNLWTCNQAN